jgi:hypothetical protein
VFVGGQNDGKTIARSPEMRCITALAARAWGNSARRQRLSLEWTIGLQARLDGKKRFGLHMADRARRRRAHATGREPRLSIRLTRGGRFGRSFGELALRADPHFIRRWRPYEPVLESLPAYPSRLSRDAHNAIWLALFAPRSQLVEFVLSESRYRRRMLSEIDPDYWIAPCLRAGHAPQEPTQQGGVRQLGAR